MSTNPELLEERADEEELKQLLASLPKHKGFTFNDLYQFHGFWYAPPHLQAVLNSRSHFRALPSDILLATVPKSGTTWLKALLFALVHRPANALQPLTTQNPHDLVPFLEVKLFADPNRVPDLSGIPSPRLFATHMAAPLLPSTVLDSGCKVVYMCRDPRDMFVSLWHFANRVRGPDVSELSLEGAFDSFCEGIYPSGPFWDHVLGYWEQSVETPSRVLFLKYEDVRGDTASCLRRLAEFVGQPFSEDEEKQGVVDRIVELCSFQRLSNLEVNRLGRQTSGGVENKAYFRRGQVGDWRNYLTPQMTLRLDHILKDKLHVSGFNCY